MKWTKAMKEAHGKKIKAAKIRKLYEEAVSPARLARLKAGVKAYGEATMKRIKAAKRRSRERKDADTASAQIRQVLPNGLLREQIRQAVREALPSIIAEEVAAALGEKP